MKMRERVEKAVFLQAVSSSDDTEADIFDLTFEAVIEALAAEAERQHGTLLVHGIPDMFGAVTYGEGMLDGYMISSWLRGHIGDTEAADE